MSDLALHDWPLPYESRLAERALADIDLVVMHCTETPDLASAREFGERVLYDSGTGNSGHYYIDREGTVHVFVRPARVAHHTRGYNPRSIGIELVNTGRYPDWYDSRRQAMDEPYTEAQIASLLQLLKHLKSELPKLRFIAGHEELDTDTVEASDDASQRVFRKRDPGPRFPWPQVLQNSGLDKLAD
ncbi:MAG TPA: N-acetylmuramoyl-L-alanine amidase [Arenimonas sp.]|nr:N-acetylmuramoyl-L-alanine amidase [Arenimonas sp.]